MPALALKPESAIEQIQWMIENGHIATEQSAEEIIERSYSEPLYFKRPRGRKYICSVAGDRDENGSCIYIHIDV